MTSGDPLGELFPRFDGEMAFLAYEHVRHRLPGARHPALAAGADDLVSLAGRFDVFVFDAFGVLNVGDQPIPGAVEAVARLRAMGKRLFVVTNGASLTAAKAPEKFRKLGFDFSPDEIISSRMAAETVMAERCGGVWCVMPPPGFDPAELAPDAIALEDDPAAYERAEAFLLLSTLVWTAERQALLEASLKARPRPVIVANPDIVAPRETGFSTEPGYCGHRLAQHLGLDVEFHGKPFGSVYELVMAALPQHADRRRICMIGDTLHTDVLGGAAAGWSTVLVSDHGLFKGLDPARYIERSGIVPDYIIPTI
ncbi:HAD superfamily hydrolase (TIGR01459 family) [Hoeflea marina]|uniref:HAD superfamily hydrolase (TIGR01459 family) n=1 Tax=Hoeflea marina TaxID=274592 RepID=A0A317PBV0_9HYPH|nr:HAD-IIA family hydrolase [Hoeflea marina]PWV95384.1 HAD superfamily hydrolase (TIGR01459 family) [Hoeflea marina]